MVNIRYLYMRFREINSMVNCLSHSYDDDLDDALYNALNKTLKNLKFYFPSLDDEIEEVIRVNDITKCAEVRVLLESMKKAMVDGEVENLRVDY